MKQNFEIIQLTGGCSPAFVPTATRYPTGVQRPHGHGFGNIIPHPDQYPDPAC